MTETPTPKPPDPPDLEPLARQAIADLERLTASMESLKKAMTHPGAKYNEKAAALHTHGMLVLLAMAAGLAATWGGREPYAKLHGRVRDHLDPRINPDLTFGERVTGLVGIITDALKLSRFGFGTGRPTGPVR